MILHMLYVCIMQNSMHFNSHVYTHSAQVGYHVLPFERTAFNVTQTAKTNLMVNGPSLVHCYTATG